MVKISVNIITKKDLHSYEIRISATPIDDYYFSPHRKNFIVTLTQAKSGTLQVHAKESHVVDVKGIFVRKRLFFFRRKNTFHYSNIMRLDEDKQIIINLDAVPEKIISDSAIEQEYQERRTDNHACFFCKKKYTKLTDKYVCKYCRKCFCSQHRNPELHDCWKHLCKPISPSKSFREIHTKSGLHVMGK